MYKEIKRRVFQILEGCDEQDQVSRLVNFFIITLILANVAAILLETEASIYNIYAWHFQVFEVFSVAVFSVEYLLRLWVCTEKAEYSRPLSGRLRYMTSFLAVIDLLAILPFYLPMLLTVNLRVIRILRIFRLFRLLKLARYTNAADTIFKVVRDRKAELGITMFMGAILLIISSTLVYYAECDAQPEKYSSIISSMWWSIITLLTVGYGDVYPITPLGKIFGALTAIFGIALFALPAGLITSGFMELLNKQKESDAVKVCPHCGQDLTKPHGPGRIETVAVAPVKQDRRIKP